MNLLLLFDVEFKICYFDGNLFPKYRQINIAKQNKSFSSFSILILISVSVNLFVLLICWAMNIKTGFVSPYDFSSIPRAPLTIAFSKAKISFGLWNQLNFSSFFFLIDNVGEFILADPISFWQINFFSHPTN